MESASDSAAQEILPVPDLLKNLSIQKDEPLFAQEFSSDQDIFNHEAFADALLKLILANNPPLSVGLFGSWGIGKSTIVNILKKKIDEGYSERLKPIYFNAWKYSGDSFRRQFLLEMATQVFGKGHSEVERLKQLNYGDVLRKDRQQRFLGAIKEAVRDAMSMPMALRSKGIARFILGCLTLLGGVAIAAGVSSTRPVVATFIIGVIVPAVFLWFADMKFEDLFVVQETPLLDPKMIFPEQFESEFHNILQSQQLKDKRAVIAIDDIDRCEPAVIKDILISMKTFMGHEQCFFIVPCDDKTVIDVFADPKQAAGYGDESLRKYFNVGLRIPPITSTDLVDFANTVARKTKLPDEIIQIAVLANCRDARKMKHFLNSLAVKYTIAKGREKSKMLSASVDDNLPELAKAVLLEDSYPNLFEQIVENPRIYDVLERAALNGETEELVALGLANWEKTYPRLREILERTRDTQMLHADVFFSLKSTNPEVKMPRGTEYKTAVIEGNTSLQEAIISQVSALESKVAVADLLLDLVKKSKGRFLHNAIDASLRAYRRRDFFEGPSGGRVRAAILSHLLYRDTTNVVTYDAESVLGCAKDAGAGAIQKILAKYQRDIRGIESAETPQGIKNVIEALYRYEHTRALFASALNQKLAEWTSKRSGLQLLKALELPNNLKVDEKIPNGWLTEIIVQNVTLDITQLADDSLRLGVINKNWDPKYADILIPRFVNLFSLSQSNDSFEPSLKAVLDFFIENPHVLAVTNADQLWPLVQNAYGRISNSETKKQLIWVITIFSLISAQAGVRAAAKDTLQAIWKSMSDPFLRENLKFIGGIAAPESSALIRLCIAQELELASSELSSPNDRTWQRLELCFNFETLLDKLALDELFLRALSVTQPEAFSQWLTAYERFDDQLSHELRKKIVRTALGLVPTTSHIPGRQSLLLGVFAAQLGRLSREERVQFIDPFISSLKGPEPSTRDAAASSLTLIRVALGSDSDLRLALAKVIDDVSREVQTAMLPQYLLVIESIAAQKELVVDYRWRDIADMARRLISHSDTGFQLGGLRLVGLMHVIPDQEQDDLIHGLVSLASSPDLQVREQASAVILKTRPLINSPNAKRILLEHIGKGE